MQEQPINLAQNQQKVNENLSVEQAFQQVLFSLNNDIVKNTIKIG